MHDECISEARVWEMQSFLSTGILIYIISAEPFFPWKSIFQMDCVQNQDPCIHPCTCLSIHTSIYPSTHPIKMYLLNTSCGSGAVQCEQNICSPCPHGAYRWGRKIRKIVITNEYVIANFEKLYETKTRVLWERRRDKALFRWSAKASLSSALWYHCSLFS